MADSTSLSSLAKPMTSLAKAACEAFPVSNVEAALKFVEVACPKFYGMSNDRLMKVGRSMRNLVDMEEELGADKLEQSLKLLVQEASLIASGKLTVPRVPFGKTGLQISTVTLGCMRFQQAWGPKIQNMNMVDGDCQENLVNILKTAILDYGINHIETARGYGCSELQLGVALKQLFKTTHIKREDLLIQTKINPFKDPADFRKQLETSMKLLQVDYLDLMSIHGFNLPQQEEYVFGNNGDNIYKVIQEFMKEGKIRHLGFSTHGPTEFIMKMINKDVFEYVNLHYHFVGSYTASGGGHDGNGNHDCVKLLTEKNMGVFIISPYDKGGKLYCPSRKMRKLTLPELEPMDFESLWTFNHHKVVPGACQLHTFTVGAARPSDLDQPAVAAYLNTTQHDEMLARTRIVADRLTAEREKVLGKQWVETWWKGLPKALYNKNGIEHNQLVWCYNNILAFGLYEHARDRYRSFEGNRKKWDNSKSYEENVEKIGMISWGYVPGVAPEEGKDYEEDLKDVPTENKARVKEAREFVMKWLATKEPKKAEESKDGEQKEASKTDEEKIPRDWETAYEMKTWKDFPDRIVRVD